MGGGLGDQIDRSVKAEFRQALPVSFRMDDPSLSLTQRQAGERRCRRERLVWQDVVTDKHDPRIAGSPPDHANCRPEAGGKEGMPPVDNHEVRCLMTDISGNL